MPTSAFAGRGFFTTHLERVAEDLKTVIDFGPGEGTYSILGRHLAPQGSSHGNDHEAHLHDWSFEEMSDLLLRLNPVRWDAWRGHTVGRWWLDLH